MARDCPLVLVGEFDAITGAKMTYAFECFDYSGDSSLVSSNSASYSATRQLQYLSGKVLLGRHVASGCHINSAYVVYCNYVAQRVLNSNETREESLIFCDGNGMSVGSFAFTLPDILARGEKRRFCLAFIHPVQEEMVRRWPQLSLLARMLISRWLTVLNGRYTLEYETFCNLDRMRELSHKRPLRSLMTLLAQHGESEMEALRGVHCFLDCALPMLFLRQCTTAIDYNDDPAEEEWIMARKIGCKIEEQLPIAEAGTDCVEIINEWDTVVVQPRAHRIFLRDRRIIVKPLTVWLAEFIADTSPTIDSNISGANVSRLARHSDRRHSTVCYASHKSDSALMGATSLSSACTIRDAIHVLLHALFSGDLIVISGDDASTCASLALALSYALPRSLAHFAIFAKDYPVAHGPRIVSFDDEFLATHEVRSHEEDNIPRNNHHHKSIIRNLRHADSDAGSSNTQSTLALPNYSITTQKYANERADMSTPAMQGNQADDGNSQISAVNSARSSSRGNDDDQVRDGKSRVILSQLCYDGMVHVVVRQDRIVEVCDCSVLLTDDTSTSTATTTITAPKKMDQVRKYKRTTLADRIIALLDSSVESEGGEHVSVNTYKLLTAQLRQLVYEYVVRGTVYSSLFKSQEMRVNRAILATCDSGNTHPNSSTTRRRCSSKSSTGSLVASSQFSPVLMLKGSMSRMLGIRSDASSHDTLLTTQSAEDSGGAAKLRKHKSLQEIAGRAFARERYTFSSSTAEDHSILIFLGCASD